MTAKDRARRMAAVACGVALAAVTAATPALADPSPVTDYGLLAAVGSDTTQDVMNGLGNVLKTDSNGDGLVEDRLIASWDARGSATITTKSLFDNTDANGRGCGVTDLTGNS